MILYFDSSAIVPLTIEEPSSERCGQLWDSTCTRASSRMTYVEVAAALASAARRFRISEKTRLLAMQVLDELWSDMTIVEVDDNLVRGAADIARSAGLGGYDAVHAASALRLMTDDVIGVSGDHELLSAWKRFGLDTVDSNQQSL